MSRPYQPGDLPALVKYAQSPEGQRLGRFQQGQYESGDLKFLVSFAQTPQGKAYAEQQNRSQQEKPFQPLPGSRLATEKETSAFYASVGTPELAGKYSLYIGPKGEYQISPEAVAAIPMTGKGGEAISAYPIFETAALVGISLVVPPAAILVGLGGAGLSGGIKYFSTGGFGKGQLLTGEEMVQSMLIGESLYVVGSGVHAGIGGTKLGALALRSPLGRLGLSTGMGAGVSVGLGEGFKLASTGKPLTLEELGMAAGTGAGLGFGFGLLGETVRYVRYVRTPRVPSTGVVDVPDIGYTAPRTMSEKVLGLPELKSPYQVTGFKALEAEATATEMGVAPKTAMIDPLAELVEPPTLEKPIAGMPYLPKPEVTARIRDVGFMPQAFSVGGVLGLQALNLASKQPERSIRVPSVSPLLRGVPKLDLGLAMDPDIASSLDLSPLTIQSPSTAQLSKTMQIQSTQQVAETVFEPKYMQTFQFTRQTPFDQDFNKLFTVGKRKKGGGWERRYMWTFPVKGPKETWKTLQKG